jgi:hypothetical protein
VTRRCGNPALGERGLQCLPNAPQMHWVPRVSQPGVAMATQVSRGVFWEGSAIWSGRPTKCVVLGDCAIWSNGIMAVLHPGVILSIWPRCSYVCLLYFQHRTSIQLSVYALMFSLPIASGSVDTCPSLKPIGHSVLLGIHNRTLGPYFGRH